MKCQKGNVYCSLIAVISLKQVDPPNWIPAFAWAAQEMIPACHGRRPAAQRVPVSLQHGFSVGDSPYKACQIQKKQFSKRCNQILMKCNSFLDLPFMEDIIDKNNLCSESLCYLAALPRYFPPLRGGLFLQINERNCIFWQRTLLTMWSVRIFEFYSFDFSKLHNHWAQQKPKNTATVGYTEQPNKVPQDIWQLRCWI